MGRYFDDFNTNDEILHYGVKGMKWRKRLKRKLSGMSIQANRDIKMKQEFNKIDQFNSDNARKRGASVERGDFRIGKNRYENLILTSSQKAQHAEDSKKEADRKKDNIKKRNKEIKRLRAKEKITRKLANLL